MVKDPVCGMQLDETKAAETSVFQGKTYYFCSTNCKANFEKNPQEYAAN